MNSTDALSRSRCREWRLHKWVACKRQSADILVSIELQWLAVWLGDNALVSINVVTLRWARLVPGWVTVFGRVNYIGM